MIFNLTSGALLQIVQGKLVVGERPTRDNVKKNATWLGPVVDLSKKQKVGARVFCRFNGSSAS